MSKLTTFGPTEKTTLHCDGCPALHTEDWVFHEENDGIDRGTDAKCTAMEPNKHIGSYWHSGDRAPDWCPAGRAVLANGDEGK